MLGSTRWLSSSSISHAAVRRWISSTSSVPATIPIIHTLEELKAWRQQAREEHRSVGVVPTMGALHKGHLNLGMFTNATARLLAIRNLTLTFACQAVRHSLTNNPLTVLTLFVNPTQFAPHEDLASYPRTLHSDVEKLGDLLQGMRNDSGCKDMVALRDSQAVSPLVVFAPSREVMYPLSLLKDPATGKMLGESMLQDTTKQRGAFVEVKGWGNVMEGRSRRECMDASKDSNLRLMGIIDGAF